MWVCAYPVPRVPPNPKPPDPLVPSPQETLKVCLPTHHDVPPYVHGPVPRDPLTPSLLTPCPSPQENPKGVLVPKTSWCSTLCSWSRAPRPPLTPSLLTPCPSPQETLKVCLYQNIMMFHPMFMVPCPETPLTPSLLTPCPSPQETLKVCLYQNIMMFHPPIISFCFSKVVLLQVTEFLVSQVTCPPLGFLQISEANHRGYRLKVKAIPLNAAIWLFARRVCWTVGQRGW